LQKLIDEQIEKENAVEEVIVENNYSIEDTSKNPMDAVLKKK
ncbi:MAG: hypothetical protein RL308_3011, partial [Bacteroidota bacterium]